MKSLNIKNLIIGEGTPKICVPIVATSQDELLQQLPQYQNNTNFDLIEWRGDFLPIINNIDYALQLAKILRKEFPTLPILFTFRTKQEGGEQAISFKDYAKLNLALAKSGLVDLIDLELFATEDSTQLTNLVSQLHATNVKIIFSNHDFSKTPTEETITSRLAAMESFHADIAKIAVMPQNAQDVVTLLAATVKANTILKIPVVTMSMGKLGAISRICGETFGSSITFGSLTKASAPGQISVDKLRDILSTCSF